MKLILFSGDHPRHLFINKEVLNYFDDVLIICMERENLLPQAPNGLQQHDTELFEKHFQKRFDVESKTYGELEARLIFNDYKTLYIKPGELNTYTIANEVHEFNADFCFIFGVDLILDPVIDMLPANKINLHLGLSPWYKGGATLFWPFYHLEPQFCGATFHQITKSADAGEIIHQCVPELAFGDTIHDVGAKCVLKAKHDLTFLLDHWVKFQHFDGQKQTTSGRNWRGVDFHPAHLRVIYDLYDDKIVDCFLEGNLALRRPKLFSCIS